MPGTQNLAEARFQDELTIPQQKKSISWTAHSQSPRCTGGQTGWLSTEATGRRGGHPETSLRRGLSSPWPWEMSTVYFYWAQETHHCGYLKEQKSAPVFLLSWKCNEFPYSWPMVLMQHRAEDFRAGFYRVLNKLFAKVSSIWSTNY